MTKNAKDTTTIDAVTTLLESLGHELEDVAQIEIRVGGSIRVLGKDRSLRAHRVEWGSAL